MPCIVKKTFEAAQETGNFLIAQVKGNQPTLLEDLTAVCASQAPVDRHETVDRKRHGREEYRRVETFTVDPKSLNPDWDGLIVAVARVSRRFWIKDTKSGLWHLAAETSLYAAQIPLSAAAAAAAIRQHWSIENRNHHVRDVSLFEDHSRIRIKPGHFARFRSFALNILRANGATNISQELYRNALNQMHALSYRVT